MKRRTLLKAAAQLAVAATLVPGRAQAAYPMKAFLAEEIPDAMREVFGTADIGISDKIEIDAPHIASDGNLVPVRIRSGLEQTESISIIVPANKTPFTAHFKLYEQQSFVSTRLRMAASGELLVVVKADGGLHTARRPIRVGRTECGT